MNHTGSFLRSGPSRSPTWSSCCSMPCPPVPWISPPTCRDRGSQSHLLAAGGPQVTGTDLRSCCEATWCVGSIGPNTGQLQHHFRPRMPLRYQGRALQMILSYPVFWSLAQHPLRKISRDSNTAPHYQTLTSLLGTEQAWAQNPQQDLQTFEFSLWKQKIER